MFVLLFAVVLLLQSVSAVPSSLQTLRTSNQTVTSTVNSTSAAQTPQPATSPLAPVVTTVQNVTKRVDVSSRALSADNTTDPFAVAIESVQSNNTTIISNATMPEHSRDRNVTSKFSNTTHSQVHHETAVDRSGNNTLIKNTTHTTSANSSSTPVHSMRIEPERTEVRHTNSSTTVTTEKSNKASAASKVDTPLYLQPEAYTIAIIVAMLAIA